LSGNYISSNVAYDQKINAINSGVGIVLSGDWQSQETIENYAARVFYAYHHKISENFTFLCGMNLGLKQKRINLSNLTFGDVIDTQNGFIYWSNNAPSQPKAYFDLTSGIAGYTKNIYFGVSAQNLVQANLTNSSHNS
jgi:hypothetical protein